MIQVKNSSGIISDSERSNETDRNAGEHSSQSFPEAYIFKLPAEKLPFPGFKSPIEEKQYKRYGYSIGVVPKNDI
jgi:hypothetical protein